MTSRIILDAVPNLPPIRVSAPSQRTATSHVVLLSGGIDSMACLAFVRQAGSPVSALFVDYGQPPAESEALASAAVADWFGVDLKKVTYRGQTFGQGEIRGRNAFLAHLALLSVPLETAVVVLGIHAGTGYRDCSPDFVQLIQESYDFHTSGRFVLSTPFINQIKGQVLGLAVSLGLPLELTHSCEAANKPCGTCLSCADRAALIART